MTDLQTALSATVTTESAATRPDWTRATSTQWRVLR